MRKSVLRMLALAMLLALALGMMPAFAAGKASIIPQTLWMCDNKVSPDELYMIKYKNLPKNAELISAESSNENVLWVNGWIDDEFDNIKGFLLCTAKPGKARVTVTYKVGKKTYDISAVYTVKKHPKPINSLTLNGKKINFMKQWQGVYYEYEAKKNGASYKLNLKPKSGWKISKVWVYRNNRWTKFSNNKAFKLSWKKGEDADIGVKYLLKNTKGEPFYYRFWITHYTWND